MSLYLSSALGACPLLDHAPRPPIRRTFVRHLLAWRKRYTRAVLLIAVLYLLSRLPGIIGSRDEWTQCDVLSIPRFVGDQAGEWQLWDLKSIMPIVEEREETVIILYTLRKIAGGTVCSTTATFRFHGRLMLALMRGKDEQEPNVSAAVLQETEQGYYEIGEPAPSGTSVYFLLHRHGPEKRASWLMKLSASPTAPNGEVAMEMSEERLLPDDGEYELHRFPVESAPFLVRVRAACPNPLVSIEPAIPVPGDASWPRFCGLQAGAVAERLIAGADSLLIGSRRCLSSSDEQPSVGVQWAVCGLDGRCTQLGLDAGEFVYSDRENKRYLFRVVAPAAKAPTHCLWSAQGRILPASEQWAKEMCACGSHMCLATAGGADEEEYLVMRVFGPTEGAFVPVRLPPLSEPVLAGGGAGAAAVSGAVGQLSPSRGPYWLASRRPAIQLQHHGVGTPNEVHIWRRATWSWRTPEPEEIRVESVRAPLRPFVLSATPLVAFPVPVVPPRRTGDSSQASPPSLGSSFDKCDAHKLPGTLARLPQSEMDTMALTFEDAPTPFVLPLLEVLSTAGVRATFFVSGRRVVQYPDILARIVAEGHRVGLVGWSGRRLKGLSAPEMLEEVRRGQTQIALVTGEQPCFLHPPQDEGDAALERSARWQGVATVYSTLRVPAARATGAGAPLVFAGEILARLPRFDDRIFPETRLPCSQSSPKAPCRGHIISISVALETGSAEAEIAIGGLPILLAKLKADKWEFVGVDGQRFP